MGRDTRLAAPGRGATHCGEGNRGNRSALLSEGVWRSVGDAGKVVLISGVGVAGPSLAYWLDRRGLVPTLVERAQALRQGGLHHRLLGRGLRHR